MKHTMNAFVSRMGLALVLPFAALGSWVPAGAQTPLADQPVFSSASVPGNLALALSVEFPTAISVAHPNRTYSSANTYKGYFDHNKCYVYNYVSASSADNYFKPSGAAASRACTGGKWSGNYLNWATMQTIDPFRMVLTGGYRVHDTATLTVLEKAWASNQGSTSNFPDSTISSGVSGATPFTSSSVSTRVWAQGNKFRFKTGDTSGLGGTAIHYDPAVALVDGQLYEAYVRVKVCDPLADPSEREGNCTQYGTSYKPTGLMHTYSDRIRFSAFGYLNDNALARDGGVLRAQQKFIAPTQPVPGGVPVANALAEWDASNGVLVRNPDTADATATTTATGITISDSGVINYLNKFGQLNPTNGYKTYDPVGELYYAALRYYRNLGNVASYSSMGSADTATKTRYLDGFPVITNWADPVQYSCQKNFILGIGDVNTHADRNLPGATGSSEPTKPSEVTADTTINAVTGTNKVGALHGLGASLGTTQPFGGCCTNNGALMAGLAYYANTKDMRTDLSGMQTVQTYWLDVLEYGAYKANNQFYLAAKYGGFTVPDGFNPDSRATDIDATSWRTNTDTVGGQPRPDNYFTASEPDQVIKGLTDAFASIASKVRAYSTSFSTSLPQVSVTGTAAYSTQYDAKSWTGELLASSAAFDASTGVPSLTPAWSFSTTLNTLATGTGWDTTRRVVTYNTVGVPFRTGNLSTAQLAALNTGYVAGDDSTNYLNYLRGERKHEKSSTVSGSTKAYRDRAVLVGDIVNSKARPVGPPALPYSDATNAGYSTFKTTYASRPTVVYVGTNHGMLHAVNGTLSGTGAGAEIFAYVPSALFSGPTGTPAVNGLQAVGNPTFTHYNFVDGTPVSVDVDLGKTVGGSGTVWRTLVLGGLGKGGKSLYAIDATNPAGVTDEATAAARILWEFSDTHMGYTYGQPSVVKTRKYGWVVVAGSGYNNSDGKGYFYFINPRTGALLEKITTGAGTPSAQAGMAHVQAFVLDLTDGVADAVYAGDLLGNLWRLDVSASSGSYPAPVKLAVLTDSTGAALPVTSRPVVAIQPGSNRRYVTVGTGRLLDSSDVSSSQAQRFFAIIDGYNNRFSVDGTIAGDTSTLPASWTFPHTVSRFKEQTNVLNKISLDLATQIGWYVDLGRTGPSGPGWRVISDPASFYGKVSFAATSPSSSDACNPAGSSRVYVIDLGDGSSALTSTTGYYDGAAGVVVDLQFYSVRDPTTGKSVPRLVVGTNSTTGKNLDAPPMNPLPPVGLQRMNWREIPATD